MKRLVLFLCLLHIGYAQKVHYHFTNEPIDVVIPCAKSDKDVLNLAIAGIKNNGENIRRVIVVSKEKLTENAEWFSEEEFPFNKEAIALEIFKGDRGQAMKYLHGYNRLGWILQQLIKLYAMQVIPGISSNVLVLDADSIYLNSTYFMENDGVPYLNIANEYMPPYFDHMKRLIPWLKRETCYSGITHNMLFQKCVIDDLFSTIESYHDMPVWKALCRCVEELHWACMSEYEIYFNFLLARSDQAKVRRLKWCDNESLKNLSHYRISGYNYVSCHGWMRKN